MQQQECYICQLAAEEVDALTQQFERCFPFIPNEDTPSHKAEKDAWDKRKADWCEAQARLMVKYRGYPLLYSTSTYRISCFDRDEQDQPQRGLIHDIEPSVLIFASQARPGAYIFLREEDAGFESSSALLLSYQEMEAIPWLEVRPQGASIDLPPIAAFAYGDVWMGGVTIEDVEAQLRGHLANAIYHAWDCPSTCPWCNDLPPTDVDEQGIHYALWNLASDAAGPILLVDFIQESDRAWLTEAGVLIEEAIMAIDPYSKRAESFVRLSCPAGTKLGPNGGWWHLQLPNKLEIEHKVIRHYDSVDGTTTGSSRIEKVKHWDCRWPDSSNRTEPQSLSPSPAGTDNGHPF